MLIAASSSSVCFITSPKRAARGASQCMMDEAGVMNDNAGDFRGLDRFEARSRIVEALRDAGYLEKIETHRRSCRSPRSS